MKNYEILKIAREKYKEGTYIISASGKLKSPCRVIGKIIWSLDYPECLKSEGFGVIYDGTTGKWAEIVNIEDYK